MIPIERFETTVSMDMRTEAQTTYTGPSSRLKPTRNGLAQLDVAADSWNQFGSGFFDLNSNNVTRMNEQSFGYNANLCSSLSQQQKLEHATFTSSSALQRVQFSGIDQDMWRSESCCPLVWSVES